MRDDKGNKLRSIAATRWRLGNLFHLLLDELTPERCRADEALRTRPRPKTNRPLAVDSHRNILAEARSFLRWCVGKKWIARNPLDGVEGVGKRRHGKEQLRIDEARRWQAKAIEFAEQGEAGAVAAMMSLLMGMRASEMVAGSFAISTTRGGCSGSRTRRPRRGGESCRCRSSCSRTLRPLARGREPTAALFGEHWRDWPRKWVQRICKAAGVPKVTAHGMRGLHGTLAVDSGVTSHAVAAALGHESFKTTAESYAKREAVAGAQQQTGARRCWREGRLAS